MSPAGAEPRFAGVQSLLERWRREVCRLLSEILLEQELHVDRFGRLTSEGRKVLERAIRILLDNDPAKRRLVYSIRREATVESVEKLMSFIGCQSLP